MTLAGHEDAGAHDRNGQRMLKKTLLSLVVIVGVAIAGVVGMFAMRACPPEGPWPQPPWCDVYDYDRQGEVVALFDHPVLLTNIDQRQIPAPPSTLFEHLGVTGLGWQGLGIENVGFRLGSRQLISTAHGLGLPVVCSMNVIYLIRTTDVGRPETALQDIHGQPLPASLVTPGYTTDGDFLRNILHPGYREMLLDDIRTNFELGCEGIVFDDDGAGEAARIMAVGAASFDEVSLTGFRDHLAASFDTATLAARFDIDDIDGFDLAEHLRREGIVDTWFVRDDGPPHPLAHEYAVFRSTRGRQIVAGVLEEAREWARAELGREVLFGFNASPLFADKWVVAAHEPADVLWGEHFWFDRYHVKGAVAAKLAEGISPRQFVMLLEVKHDQGELPTRSGNLFAHAFADVYSTGNASLQLTYPGYWTMRDWTYVEAIEYDDDVIARHAAFLRDHPDLFGLEEPARVAVVHSMPSRLLEHLPIDANLHAGGAPARQTIALIDLLLNLDVPFHMLTTGTDADGAERLDPVRLADHDVVIVPHALAVADEDVTTLVRYAQGGGTVVQINEFATLDSSGTAVEREDLAGFADTPGVHEFGEGTWHTVDWGAFDVGYLWDGVARHLLPREQDPDHPARVRLREMLAEHVDRVVVSDAPMTVNLRRFVDGDRTVLHLVNYDFDQTADAFVSAGDLEVTVVLPEGAQPDRALAYDVYEGRTLELDMELADGRATIQVPGFASYLIVELS